MKSYYSFFCFSSLPTCGTAPKCPTSVHGGPQPEHFPCRYQPAAPGSLRKHFWFWGHFFSVSIYFEKVSCFLKFFRSVFAIKLQQYQQHQHFEGKAHPHLKMCSLSHIYTVHIFQNRRDPYNFLYWKVFLHNHLVLSKYKLPIWLLLFLFYF